ncbi:MAG: diacylglycerol kinase family lipid kinase [Candidatus Caldatribacteriota bacterium]
MKTEIIINLTAGGGKPKIHLETVLNYLKENGLNFRLKMTSHSGEATELARKAADEGMEVIISVGGDGTINEIINGIMQSKNDPALGIIPLGWANDFIKSTDISPNIIKACQTLIKGKTKRIDLGLINQKIYFVNICGVGFDAEIAHLANQIKSKHPHWNTLSAYVYILATLKKLLAPFSYHQVSLKIDGQEIHTKILFAAIGNGQIYGGRFKITPEAVLDDGLLDICIVESMGRLKYILSIPKVCQGTHKSIKGVTFYRAKEIIIESSYPILAQVSGEIIESQNKFTITSLPKRLKLIVP